MTSTYLQDRVVLVTGGGGGIGAAAARFLAAQGARVVVNDLGVALDGTGGGTSAADGVVADISAAGGTAVADYGDVSDFDTAGRLVQQCVERFGRLDVLVNCAGILRDRMIFNMAPDEWDAVIRLHLRGLFNLTRHASAHWRATAQQGPPAIDRRLVTVTSRSGLFGAATQPNYSAAKLGVVGFTFSCAKSLAKYGVTSIALCPTAETRMTATVPGSRKAIDEGSTAASPDNVAKVIAYLAGPDSGWLNGQIVGSNGFEVALYSRPTIVRSLVKDRPWALEELVEQLPAGFGAVAASQANLGVAAQ